MATGNLGDLEMSLTLKSRVEDEVKGIVRSMNSLDASGKRAQEAIDAISSAFKSMHKGTAEVTKLSAVLEKLNAEIDLERSMEFPSQKTLTKLNKVAEGLSRVKDILGQMSRDGANGFNIFPNGISSEVNAAQKAMNKLSGIAKELNKWEGKGFQLFDVKNTDNIRQASSELSKYRTILEQIRNNGGTHPITGLTASDITKSAEYIAALDKAKASAKEVKQAIADANFDAKISADIEKQRQQLMAKEAAEKENLNKKEQEYQLRQQAILDLEKQVTEEKRKQREAEQKKSDKDNAAEYDRKKKQSEQYLEQLNKEGIYLQKNAATQERLLRQQQEMRDKNWANATKESHNFGKYNAPGRLSVSSEYYDLGKTYYNAAKALEAQHRENEAKIDKQLDGYTRAYKAVEKEIKALSPKMDGKTFQGKALSARDMARYNEMLAQLEHLKNTKGADVDLALFNHSQEEQKIKNLIALAEQYREVAEKAAKATYTPYNSDNYEQKRIQETAALKKAILDRYEAEKKVEAEDKKEEARAKAAEKQRQSEIERSQRRIQSLTYAYQKLQEQISTAKGLRVDTTEAEEKLKRMSGEIETLKIMLKNLQGSSFNAYLGDIGQVGNGRSVQEANHFTQELKNANAEAKRAIDLEERRKQKIAKSASKVRSDLVKSFEQASNAASKMNSTLSDIKSLFLQGGIVYGAWQFANSIIQTGGEMEKQHIALQSILGDMQNANTMFAQVKELALNSPFTFSELNRDVKQLAAYGVEYDQLYDTTKRLADMSSGLGVSFDRIALAFGQVQARGWLDGKELRQIAYAGIPLLSKLSEYYSKIEGKNVSTSEIKTRISKREVSFDDVKNIFWQMTNEGGQFYNMQQTLSETLLGRYNKLKDAWEIMLSEFASGNSLVGGFFKTALDGATALVQALNKLGGPIAAIAAGYSIKKMLAGGVASSFLSNKAGIASNIQSNILQGKQVSQMERQILATKNQITSTDLRMLASEKALTVEKLNQLRISGQITAEQYRTYRGIVLRQTGEKTVKMEMLRTLVAMRSMSLNSSFKALWIGFATSAQAAISVVGTGLKSLGATLWSAIGGLPGLIITGLTFGVTYAISSYRELSQKISQTQDEIANRQAQINKFLQENNAGAAIGSGDTKQIDNMIDAYKEKLKELAPYSYKSMLMSADEEKSHEDRLKYLEKELKLLRDANTLASAKMGNRSFYSNLEDSIKNAQEKLAQRQGMHSIATQPGASQGDIDAYNNEKAYNDYVNKIKNIIAKKFSDVGKDEKMREAAMQAMSGIFSELGVPEDKADLIRASVLQAFGCGGKSGWLKNEVGNSMISLIDTTFPMIGAKIKASIPLTDAEKAKVKELMQDAKQGLISQYPELESTLKNMLAASNFQAVIKLVYDTGDKYNETQSELTGRIPGMVDGNLGQKYRRRAEEYGKDNSWYSARNAAKTNIDTAFNNWDSAKKSGAKNTAQLWQEYQDEMSIAQTLLHYNYKGEGKKSNKPGKKNTGRQEDKELKALEERLSSYKSARQSYQKRQSYMSDEAAKKEVYELFPEVTGLNLDNYEKAVKNLLNGFKINTTERKKFQTSVYREVADWLFEEEDKKEFEKRAATFSEEMNKLSDRWDLYKSLLEKTGDKNYASAAFTTTDFLEDEKTQRLEDLYERHYHKRFKDEDLYLTDGQAKERYKLPNQYEEWKKIVDLLRSNYVQALNDGADAINQTMSTATKLDAITAKYNKKRKDAGDNKDLIARYDYMERQDKSSVLFEQLKSQVNWDGIFGNLDNYTKKELRKVRKDLNELIKGGILNGMQTSDVQSFYEGVDKLNNAIDGKSFGGMAELVKELADASKQYDDAVKEYNLALAGGADWQIETAKKKMQAAENQKRTAQGNINTKKGANVSNIAALADMFVTLGKSDGSGSALLGNAGGWSSTIATMAGANKETSEKIGNYIGMASSLAEAINEKGLGGLLSDAFGEIGGAVTSVIKSLTGLNIGLGGADYDDYNDAKEEYENLISVWDTLISKKKQYMSEHWGTEAENASKEAMALLKSEIEQAKVTALDRLASGNSIGSHSIGYRMWKGSYDYNGTNWQDVAGEISSKYGVQFDGMEDMLNMAPDVLEKIKTDYSGLWAHMDSDFKDYLDKIIEYGDQVDDMTESLTEKLTGNKFSDLVSSWGSAMATMANSSDSLVEHFEDNLRNAILNSMIENIYGKQIKSLMNKTQSYAENDDKITSSDGSTVSEYTGEEYAEIINDTEELSKQIEATRDYLKNTYHWSDDSSSSSTNTVKGITEETADIIVSYLNAIRLDVSVNRENINLIADAVGDIPDLTIIARSQLTQLDSIAQNTLRNADAAEEIVSLFKAVTTGTKKVYMN